MGLDSGRSVPRRLTRRVTHERGFATAENLVITLFGLVLLVFSVNVLLGLYAQGVVRAASNDAARVAARLGDDDPSVRAQACEAKFESVASGLLRTGDYSVSCDASDPNRVRVQVDGDFPWLLDLVPTEGIPVDADVTYRRRVGSDGR